MLFLRINCSSIIGRGFSYITPNVWNSVPESIRNTGEGIRIFALNNPTKSSQTEENREGMKVATSWTHTFLSKNKKTSYIQYMLRINYLLKKTQGREVSRTQREKQLVADVKYTSVIVTQTYKDRRNLFAWRINLRLKTPWGPRKQGDKFIKGTKSKEHHIQHIYLFLLKYTHNGFVYPHWTQQPCILRVQECISLISSQTHLF